MIIKVYNLLGQDCQACTATKRLLTQNKDTNFESLSLTSEEIDKFSDLGFNALPIVVVTDLIGTVIDQWCGLNVDKIKQYSKEN